jgi:hypothetical protein
MSGIALMLDWVMDAIDREQLEDAKQVLKSALENSKATWKVVVNEVMLQQAYALPYDRWEGYGAERVELLNFIKDKEIKNTLVITGDLHANIIGDAKVDVFTPPATPIVKEIVAGPVAQATVFEQLVAMFGEPTATTLVSGLAALLNPRCVHTDSFGYALIEADDDSLTMTLKDETGTQIVDQFRADAPPARCSLTMQAQ